MKTKTTTTKQSSKQKPIMAFYISDGNMAYIAWLEVNL